MNGEKYRVGKDNNNPITNASMAKTAVAIPTTLTKINIVEKGDGPLTVSFLTVQNHG